MLDDGSWISRIQPPRARRKKEPDVRVRVVAYKLEGSSKAYRLVTSILDPNDAPAQELATLYHERWEIESVFDEIKTPELVRQEFWGMMIAHRALRDLMYEAASEKGWDPDDVSLVHAIRIVRRTMSGAAALPP
jgi:IS4 transposase